MRVLLLKHRKAQKFRLRFLSDNNEMDNVDLGELNYSLEAGGQSQIGKGGKKQAEVEGEGKDKSQSQSKSKGKGKGSKRKGQENEGTEAGGSKKARNAKGSRSWSADAGSSSSAGRWMAYACACTCASVWRCVSTPYTHALLPSCTYQRFSRAEGPLDDDDDDDDVWTFVQAVPPPLVPARSARAKALKMALLRRVLALLVPTRRARAIAATVTLKRWVWKKCAVWRRVAKTPIARRWRRRRRRKSLRGR